MMASWEWLHQQVRHQEPALTTEQVLEIARRENAQIERHIAFIEATIAAIRAADEIEPEEVGP